MGSLGDVNLLTYMRSKTQVDVDTLDVDGMALCSSSSQCLILH